MLCLGLGWVVVIRLRIGYRARRRRIFDSRVVLFFVVFFVCVCLCVCGMMYDYCVCIFYMCVVV